MTEHEKKPSFGEAVDLLFKTLKAFDEKQQRTLVTTVCDLLDLKIISEREERQPTSGGGATPPLPPLSAREGLSGEKHHNLPTDIRSLKEQKKPKSAREMAALVAFYLKELAPEGDRRETIKTEDLEVYFKQARYELPKKLEQLLGAGKRAGYFEVVSRGEYKLTRVGYNLVAHRMPEA